MADVGQEEVRYAFLIYLSADNVCRTLKLREPRR